MDFDHIFDSNKNMNENCNLAYDLINIIVKKAEANSLNQLNENRVKKNTLVALWTNNFTEKTIFLHEESKRKNLGIYRLLKVKANRDFKRACKSAKKDFEFKERMRFIVKLN